MGRLTFGIEEEFFVVDADGRLSETGDDVVETADAGTGELQRELTRAQVESATAVCQEHDEALEQLRSLRRDLAVSAARRGCRLLPCGAPPQTPDDPPSITPIPRYERMAGHFGATARTALTCGCHVHVAIPGPEAGVLALGHLRPWLPVLLALTANSAIVDDGDSGYASWRHQQWTRWPSAGPPPRFASVQEYRSIVDAWLRAGAILDRRMVYWDVRLSEEQPTLEVRVADVAASPEDAVLLAVLVRALVARALDRDEPPPELSNEILRGHLWAAARHGVGGPCVHPRTGEQTPAIDVLTDLVATTEPELDAQGDLAFAHKGIARLAADGGGAERQRRCYARRRRAADVVDAFAVPVR